MSEAWSEPARISPGARATSVDSLGLVQSPRVQYAIVGAGWRASVYLRLAYLLPERFAVLGAVSRTAASRERIAREFGVPTYGTVEELLAAHRPDFIVLSVPWEVTPELTRTLVKADVPVLAETPPAPDLEGMRALWSDVGTSGLVQVAEQYAWMPLHAARLSLVRSGLIGTPGSVQASSTHLYHVVAMMRAFLDAGIEPVTVDSNTFFAPLVDPITPAGWTHDSRPKRARTILSTIDFGDERMGLYDFTDNQWWNPVRPDHLTVRGSIGEIHDESVVRMIDEVTPVTSRIERAVTGVGMNYEGTDLAGLTFEGRMLFRNRFRGAALMDDDIGTGELLNAMGTWTRGEGPAPYPLREGLHDHHVGLAIEESARSGAPVRTTEEAWGSA